MDGALVELFIFQMIVQIQLYQTAISQATPLLEVEQLALKVIILLLKMLVLMITMLLWAVELSTPIL